MFMRLVEEKRCGSEEERAVAEGNQDPLEQSQLPRAGDCPRPAVHVQLAIDVPRVVADGVHADHELVGDLGVLTSGGHQAEDLELAVAEGLDEGRRTKGGRRANDAARIE